MKWSLSLPGVLVCLLCSTMLRADTNIALNKTYTASVAASTSYPDTSGTELTNGVYDATATYTNAAWQGRSSTSYYHTIDLGSSKSVNKVIASFMQNTASGITYPTTVTCSYSTNGSSFTSLGTATGQTPVGNCKKYQWSGTAATARYIRVTVSGSGSWLFEDEVEVWSPSNSAPSNLVYSPSSITATVGTAIATNTPTVNGTVTSWSISPALSAGLSFSTSNGALSGTPTATKAATTYTVTATNSYGSTTATVTITVNASSSAPTLIKGTFFQIDAVSGYTTTNWDTLFLNLAAAKISDHVIWQWTCRANPDSSLYETYYPTTMSGFTKKSGMTSNDPVGDSLARASSAGVKVWLGLVWSDEWWSKGVDNATWLNNQVTYSTNTAQELWTRYGSTYGSTIAGFYLPMEIYNDYGFDTTAEQTAIKNALATICNYVHTNCGGKLTMNAPFTMDSGFITQSAWQTMWTNILGTAAIDVIAPQDGLGASEDGGTTHHTTATTAVQWFDKMQAAITAARPATELWSDLETYRVTSGNYNPATEAQLEAAIASQKSHVKKFTSFAIVPYQDPASGHTTEYNAYKTYALAQTQP